MDFEKKVQTDFGKQSKHCDISRLVQTIMMRAQRPIVLTGGPFYVLSLETFRVVSNIMYTVTFILFSIYVYIIILSYKSSIIFLELYIYLL